MIAHPGVASIYRQLDEARNWPINDPRIAELAKKIVRMLNRRDTVQMDGHGELTADIQGLGLIDQFSTNNASPSLQQLGNTIRELSKNK